MIVRASSLLSSESYDICIIGSGALGIALALALSRAGKRVIIVEAGGETITTESQSFYRCDTIGRAYHGATGGRFRVFGGSTERWGGQAMRFDEVDFERRGTVFPTTWPVRREELLPYYKQAENYMGVSDAQYDLFPNAFCEAAERFGIPSDLITQACEPFQLHYSVFTKEPRMREKYREELTTRENLIVALDCPAQMLTETPDGWISGVEIYTEEGPLAIRAESTILACGCIENTRFLLLQRDLYKLSCLPELPMLGRFFQDHPGAHLGEISFNKGTFLQDLFRLKDRDGVAYKARISWCENVRRKEERPAVSGTLLMIPRGSEYDDARHNGVSQLLMRAARPDLWLKAISSASRGSVFSPLHRTYLAVSAEDIRDNTSRISLSKLQTDAHGKPVAEIDWKVSPVVADSILSYLDAFECFLGNCSLGKLRRFSFATNRDDLLPRLQDNSHQIGATSMADSPSGGVVDRNLRVFGTKNLYVIGTSVLPTGSHANPTLTALAFGFRLSRHLTESR